MGTCYHVACGILYRFAGSVSLVAPEHRGIKRREVGAICEVGILKRGPGGIDNERAEDGNDNRRLNPPVILPQRLAHVSGWRQLQRHTRHIISRPEDLELDDVAIQCSSGVLVNEGLGRTVAI